MLSRASLPLDISAASFSKPQTTVVCTVKTAHSWVFFCPEGMIQRGGRYSTISKSKQRPSLPQDKNNFGEKLEFSFPISPGKMRRLQATHPVNNWTTDLQTREAQCCSTEHLQAANQQRLTHVIMAGSVFPQFLKYLWRLNYLFKQPCHHNLLQLTCPQALAPWFLR